MIESGLLLSPPRHTKYPIVFLRYIEVLTAALVGYPLSA